MNTFLAEFLTEFLGTTSIPTYMAWFLLALIGAILGTLLRNAIPTLKSYPFNTVQLITGFITTFVFIRFGNELTGFEPTAFGAFSIGAGSNEVGLIVAKFLGKIEKK